MKKNVKLLSLMLGILMLCITVMPVSAMAAAPADESENYMLVEVPLVRTTISPKTGTYGTFNAFLAKGVTSGTTNMAIFDWRNTDFPTGATVTKVEVYSIKTNVTGMTYYVEIGKGSTVNNINWAPDIIWSSMVTTHYFDGQSPNDYWALRFYVTRLIPNPQYDFGAGATVSTATLKVYF